MPALVDPDERRNHVVAAAFRLVLAEGMRGLTLRKVSDEAALNIGSVRHYFTGHDDLLAAAAEEVANRMGRRILARPPLTSDDTSPIDSLQGLLEELLPLDDERRDEAIVLGEFITASRTTPAFRPACAQMAADMRQVIADALATLAVTEPTEEAELLTAVLVGLTSDAVTPHGALPPDRIRLTLRRHLHRLF